MKIVLDRLEDRTLFGFGYNVATDVASYSPPGPSLCDCTANADSTDVLISGPDSNQWDGVDLGQNLISQAPVEYATGMPVVSTIDLESDGFGQPFRVSRAWVGLNDTGLSGNGWLNTSLPYLVVGRNQAPTSHDAVVSVIDNSYTQQLFMSADSDTSMQAMFDSQSKLTYSPPTETTTEDGATYAPGEFTLTDAAGNVTTFYDLPRDNGTTITAGGGITVGSIHNSAYYAQEVTNQWELDGVSGSTTDPYPFGAFKSMTDPAGNVTSAVYNSSGVLQEIDRTDSTSGAEERFYYSYSTVSNGYGGSASLVSQVALQRWNGGGWSTVRDVNYTYYSGQTSSGSADPNGRLGDLKLAQICEPIGGTNTVISTDYYRYYKFYTNSVYSPESATNIPSTTGGGDTTFDSSLGSEVYSGLKTVFQGVSYARLAAVYGTQSSIDSVADSAMTQYADNTFQYESYLQAAVQSPSYATRYAVISETAASGGCSCAGNGGVGTYTYNYFINAAGSPYPLNGSPVTSAAFYNNDLNFSGSNPDANRWYEKTVVSLPSDSSVHDQQIEYLNAIGQILLSVSVDGSTGEARPTYYRYDQDGRLILTASQAALATYDVSDPSSYEEYPDLVNFGGSTTNLSTTAGLVTLTNYATTTTATTSAGGDVAGYLKDQEVEQGYSASGSPTLISSQDYIVRDGSNGTVYLLNAATAYGASAGADARTYNYSYGFYATTSQIKSIVTTEPTISAGQNGSGTPNTTETIFDSYGRPVWTVDERGYITYTKYDPGTGAVVETISDVDPSSVSAPSVAGPTRSTSLPTALNLTTTYQVDGLGRTTEETSPNGNVTYTVYLDATHETRVYPGWIAATNSTTGPIEVSREYWPAAGASSGQQTVYDEMLTSSATPAVSGGVPTGGETIDASNIQSLSRSITDSEGQVVETDDYFSMSGITYSQATSTLGTASNDSSTGNYHATMYWYDGRGRVARTLAPSGTISRQVYDGFGEVISNWIGTNDTPSTGWWSPTNNDGSSNMVEVAAAIYDADGNPLESVQYPGGGASGRATVNYYDYRDQLVSQMTGAVESSDPADIGSPSANTASGATDTFLSVYTLDTLGETTETQTFNAEGNNPSAAGYNVSGMQLTAESTTSYDDLGQVFSTSTISVDPSSGSTGSSLTENYYYDADGNLVAEIDPLGIATKSSYDGADRNTAVYVTDGGQINNSANIGFGSSTAYAAAGSVASDVVMSETDYIYDNDSNVIETIDKTREGNDSNSSTGVLGNFSSGVLARASFKDSYYDTADRDIEDLNIGTNGSSGAWTRPGTAPSSSASNMLVSTTSYGDDGMVSQTTDPRGIVTEYSYDSLGEAIQVIQAYTGGSPGNSDDVTTNFTYDGDGHVIGVTQLMPGGTDRSTAFVYGIDTAQGSYVDSNDVLYQIQRPDPSSGSPSGTYADTYTYNAAGETLTDTMPNGAVASTKYDQLGRVFSSQTITTDGSGDPTVLLTYTTAGQMGSRQDANGNVTSYTYDGFGRLASVIAPPPESGDSPLTTSYSYDDDGRVSTVTDPLSLVTSYSYDLLGRMTSRTDPSPNGGITAGPVTSWQYDVDGDANLQVDPVEDVTRTVMDGFGRTASVTVLEPDDTTVDTSTTYGYDADGNVTSVIDGNGYETDYTFDDMNRRASQTDPSPDGIAAGGVTSWSYDAAGDVVSETDPLSNTTNSSYDARGKLISVTDPQSGVTSYGYDVSGNLTSVTDPDSNVTSYTFNQLNEMTSMTGPDVGGVSPVTTYSYDLNGNKTGEVTPDGNSIDSTYDADNRLIEVQTYNSSSGSTNTITYGYDGDGRLTTAADNNFSITNSYDGDGNLTQQITIYTNYSVTTDLTQTFDLADRRLTLLVSVNGSSAIDDSFTYNALGEWLSETYGGATIYYTYTQTGQVATVFRAYAESTYTYDHDERVTEESTVLPTSTFTESFTYDADGRITSETSSDDGERSFDYDNDGRLTDVMPGPGTSYIPEAYNYDAAGNRTNEMSAAGNDPMVTTDTGNRISNDSGGSYAYDLDGNRQVFNVSATSVTIGYSYNAFDQLINVSQYSGASAIENSSYTYSPITGQRMTLVDWGSISAQTQLFVYDPITGNPLLVLNSSGTPTEHDAPGQQLGQTMDVDGSWIISSDIGPVTDVISGDGVVFSHTVYDAYGNIESWSTAPATRFGYRGMVFDVATNLYDDNLRFYDPEQGAFITQDPTGFGGGDYNLYRYVGNDPVTNVDPSGLAVITPWDDDQSSSPQLPVQVWSNDPNTTSANIAAADAFWNQVENNTQPGPARTALHSQESSYWALQGALRHQSEWRAAAIAQAQEAARQGAENRRWTLLLWEEGHEGTRYTSCNDNETWKYVTNVALYTFYHAGADTTEGIAQGVPEQGARLADGVNDYIYLASDGLLGSSNQNYSMLSQLQNSGQVSYLNAQISTTPVLASAYAFHYNTVPLTQEHLNDWQAWGEGFGAVSQGANLLAGGLQLTSSDFSIIGFGRACFRAGTKVLVGSGFQTIEKIRLGQRVTTPGSPVKVSRIDPAQYRVVHLNFVRDGQEFHMSFLRPAKLMGDLGPGDTMQLDVFELRIKGPARVVGVEPCPPIQEGPGQLVTGTFHSDNYDMRQLKIVGLDEPIDISANHAVFSEDHQDFVSARVLQAGGKVRTIDGVAVIQSNVHLPERCEVFNLEIEGAHQYYVTERAVLVHNAATGNGVYGGPAGFSNVVDGQAIHEFAFPNALCEQTGTSLGDWEFKVGPGEAGVDATFTGDAGGQHPGFDYAELKPRTDWSYGQFEKQYNNWTDTGEILPKKTTQLWFYNENGIIGTSGVNYSVVDGVIISK